MGLREKLAAENLTAMNNRMVAIVGYITNQELVYPGIEELVVTTDGLVFARRNEDIGYNEVIGAEADLRRNWEELLGAAGLSDKEKQEAEFLYHTRVRRA